MRRFTPYLSSVCRRALGRAGLPSGPSETDDAVQQVFLSLLEGDLRSLRAYAGKSSLSGYLSVVAVRRAVEGKGAPPSGQDLSALEAQGLQVEARERDALVRRELETLPPRLQLALALQADGASLKEVGLALGITPNAAAQAVHRARRLLRGRLEALGIGKSA